MKSFGPLSVVLGGALLGLISACSSSPSPSSDMGATCSFTSASKPVFTSITSAMGNPAACPTLSVDTLNAPSGDGGSSCTTTSSGCMVTVTCGTSATAILTATSAHALSGFISVDLPSSGGDDAGTDAGGPTTCSYGVAATY